jgi:hypothetical protein
MRFSFAAVVAALAAGVVATDAVTETLTAYTTYCPEATSIVHGGSTYSISTVRAPPFVVAMWIFGWDEWTELGSMRNHRLSTFHLISHCAPSTLSSVLRSHH